MNKDQIDTVADKAWELANEPETDFEVCVLLKDCAFTIKEQQSLLDAAHKDIAGGISEIQKLQSRLEQAEKDSKMLDWLESSETSHGFCHSGYGDYRYYAHQQGGYKTVREVIDTAMQSAKESQ